MLARCSSFDRWQALALLEQDESACGTQPTRPTGFATRPGAISRCACKQGFGQKFRRFILDQSVYNCQAKPLMPPAGRPREFEESEVLLRALGAFWSRGYEATSMSDLIEATGLARGSLYQAFGDKRRLFLQSLNCYLENGRRSVKGVLLSPLDAEHSRSRHGRKAVTRERLRQVFLGSIQYCQLGAVKRGCFAVNCLSELAARDTDVLSLIEHHYEVLERYFALALARIEDIHATDEQALSRATTAKLLQVVLTGLLVMSKGPLDSASAEGVVERALEQLL